MKNFVWLGALLLLGGCATSPITLEEKNSGSTVTLSPGEKFSLSLAANPTTGYTWETAVPPDDHICKNTASHYQCHNQNNKIVGAGGIQHYSFSAIAPGKTKLKLLYRRNWETDIPPAKTFDLDIVVK